MKRKSYSRLSRRLENQSRKNLFLSMLGIIVVIFLIIKFGIPLLVSFSLFISGKSESNETSIKKTNMFVSPPVLNPTFSATNSAEINISGSAGENQEINLYLNDEIFDKTKTEKNGNFSFYITLKEGDNSIKAKTALKDKESDFSNVLLVSYKKGAPNLSIKSPTDGQSFSKDQSTVNVTGATDPGVRVTVNGFWAIIDEDNNFSYNLPLQNGDNIIKIIAEDQAGNKTEKEIKVTYSP